MEISSKQVAELRSETGAGMMDCKKALVEAGGDEKQAIEILKRNFAKIQIKRAENATSEGLIRIAVKDDGSAAAMVELQCESAPVAKADDFLFLADQCAKQLLNGPGASSPEELLKQPAPDRPGQTLQDLYEEVANKIREKIVLARVLRVSGPAGGYVHHDGKTGVLFQASGVKAAPVLKDVAMHIAALKPVATTPEQLNPDDVKKERERLTEEAAKSGKPANIVEKIVDGRLKTYYAENGVLTYQLFAKDDTKTVSQALAEQGLKAEQFTRWILGNV
jgi:elongation factor Ts